MSWATRLEVKYFNTRINSMDDYKTEFFGDAQWKQAAKEIDSIIKENGSENIHSIYLDKYCHWVLDNGSVIVPDECKCQKCRPDLYNRPVINREINRAEALNVLFIQKKNNPDFIKFVSA